MMKRLHTLAKILFTGAITAGLLLSILWAGEMLVPRIMTLPRYSPCLSTMSPPNAVVRSVSHEFDFTARINSLGLRGPEIDLEHKKSFRIAVLGSSYTYGWGVNEEDSFVYLLGRALKESGLDVEMINLGRNGGAPPQYAALAEETIPLLKPDLVIVAIGQGCDLRWSGSLASSEWYPLVFWRYFPNLSALAHKMRAPAAPDIPPPSEAPTDEEIKMEKEHNARMAKERYEQFPAEQKQRFNSLEMDVREAFLSGNVNMGVILLSMSSPDLYSGALDLSRPALRRNGKWLKKHLATIARIACGAGARTLVISVPFGAYVNRPAWENTGRMGFEIHEDMLASGAMDDSIREAAQPLPFFSATEAFRNDQDNPDLFFDYDLHMAPQGHALFARTVAPWLEEQARAAMIKPAGKILE